jgi:hypothetical protein
MAGGYSLLIEECGERRFSSGDLIKAASAKLDLKTID